MYFVFVFVAEQEDEEGCEDADVGPAGKQAKKKRPPKKTVEQNLSNINTAGTESKCEVFTHVLMIYGSNS